MSKPFEPTREHRKTVEALIGFGIPEAEIAQIITNPETHRPIDLKTLRLRFPEEIASGHTRANATVGKFIWATITGADGGAKDERSRCDLAKFWAVMRMGWKSTTIHQHEGHLDIDHHIRDEIARDIDRLAAARAAGSDPGEPVAGGTEEA